MMIHAFSVRPSIKIGNLEMPRSLLEGLFDKAEKTADLVEDINRDYLAPSDTEAKIEDCYNDTGQSHGYQDGYSFTDHHINGIAIEAPQPSASDALQDCDNASDQPSVGGFFIPSLSNPILAGLEVALTPTPLADATPPFVSPAEEARYLDGYQTGFQSGSIDAFDTNLESRFQPAFDTGSPFPDQPSAGPTSVPDFFSSPAPSVDFGGSGGGPGSDSTAD